MATGTVKWFSPAKGYGFITPDEGGKDAFIHISEVERAGMAVLNEGQRVSFEEITDRRGLKAVDLAELDPSASAADEKTQAQGRAEAAMALVDLWMGEDSEYDEEAWPKLREALDQDRLFAGKVLDE